MNKIVRSVCMIAVVALAFTSCKKNENDNAKSFAFKGSVEQFVEVNENGEFERMYIDEGLNTYFQEGDVIWVASVPAEGFSNAARYVFQGDGTTLEPVDPGTQVSPNLMEGGAYYAFYPGAAGENIFGFNTATNMTKFRVHATQNYRPEVNGVAQMPEKSVYMAAKDAEHANIEDAFLYFRNIMGALSLKLYSPERVTIKSISVTDRKFHLAGDVNLDITAVEPGTMKTLAENYDEGNALYMQELHEYIFDDLKYSLDAGTGNYTTVLDCGAGIQLPASADQATRFLIVLRPLALLQGADITIVYNDGEDDYTATIHSTKDNRIMPNVIRNIYPINVDQLIVD